MCVPACQTPKTAPVGSEAMNIRPSGPTSPGSRSSRPPASVTAFAVASTPSLAKYIVQAAGCPALCCGPIPAAAAESTMPMTYPPYCSSGSANCHPRTAE